MRELTRQGRALLISFNMSNSMEKSPSWDAKSHSVKKLPTFYENRGFITVFTRVCHWSLSWAR